ncbi:MAG: hypothetical protein Q8M66_00180 [Actinomycetota bacterium]|nr:hypothetical protein [Actinomycetota bacterium]
MRLTNASHNMRDFELLLQTNPRHRLLREDINQHNASKLNGDCLLALLDAEVTPETIIANRHGRNPNTSAPTFHNPVTPEPKTPAPAPEQKAKGKKEEFPGIDWENLDNPDIQHAILLYNDRVETYHGAQRLEPLLDEKPELAAPFQELMIRNTLADNELRHYQETRQWLHKHPLGERKKIIEELKSLNQVNFAKAYASAKQNVSRYQSQLNNGKYKDPADRARIEALVKAHQSKLDLMEELQKTK